MKKQILSLVVSFVGATLFAQANDPVVMTINGKDITKSEFEYIYKKNMTYQQNNESIAEYKDLFINLKLKVAEAEALGFDTTADFKREYAQYRMQAARPYLQDTAFYENFLHKMYDRTMRERGVSQIFVPFQNANPSPADTLAAYNKIMSAKKRIQDGETLEEIAREFAGDKRNDGNLGYVSGFVTVLPFEEMVYSTAVGAVSEPFRTRFGYHIIRINDEREAKGEVQVAHIMKRFPKDAPQDSIDLAKKKIDAVYARLQNGEDFFSVAKEETEHEYSKNKGGRISSFHYDQSLAGTPFDSVAFSLKNIGEVSQPVQSWYGWHIIKLLDKKGPNSYEKDRAKTANTISRMPDRRAIVEQAFVKQLETKYTFKKDDKAISALESEAKKATSDEEFLKKINALNMTLATFADQKITMKTVAEKLPTFKDSILRNDISLKFNEICKKELISYENDRLEQNYPEFRMLMQEYYDGMQMFAVSNVMVWEKAASDEEGLKNYFDTHKSDYTWDVPRFKGMLVCCADKKTAAQAKKIVKTSPADSVLVDLLKLNTDDKIYVHIEKGLFKKGDNKIVDKCVFKDGKYESKEFPVFFQTKGSKILNDGPDEYTDIKGLVISDYQNSLEKEWIEELHNKYTVVVNQQVLDSMK